MARDTDQRGEAGMLDYLDSKLLGVTRPNTKAWDRKNTKSAKRYDKFYLKNGTAFGFREKEQRRIEELIVYKFIGRCLLGASTFLGSEVALSLYKIARTN